MERQGRIHKKVLIDGTAADEILIWDGDSWETGDITDLTAIMPDGTAVGQMIFWNGTKWVYTETSELFWDDTDKRIGINQSVPTSALDVNETVTVKRLLAGGVTE